MTSQNSVEKNQGLPTHSHNGQDSKKLNTADWIKITAAAPTWTGREGEMLFSSDGASTFKIYVWLAGAWRSGTLT